MKILFVTFDIPWPLDSGGKIRAYNLIRQLTREHEVSLFTYYRNRGQLDYLPELEKFCASVHAFERTKVFSFKHIAATLAHPNLTSHLSHYCHSELKKELEKELSAGNYQILHLESFYTSHLLGNYPVKQVLGTENIEWQVFAKHAKQQPFYLRRPLELEALRTKFYEIKTWRKADAVIAVSKQNADVIEKKTNKPVHLVPNGVDLDYFKFKPKKKANINPTILFVGNFTYIQNRDAASYLIKNIFPHLMKKLMKIKLLVVGRHIPKSLFNIRNLNIRLRDDVDDIREVYRVADVLVSPIRAGSGTHFHILEAMAYGIPVVTTNLGVEGMVVERGKQVMVGNSAEEIVDEISNILTNEQLRAEIIKNARKLIEKEHSWESIRKKLLDVYSNL